MKIDYPVPFYANTPDDTHCFQAGLKMILKYFWPDEEFSWEELETISAKQPGMWTWPMAGLLWLREQDFEVRHIEEFDYAAFSDDAPAYLEHLYGAEMAAEQIKHSNIDQEVAWARKFAENGIPENRIPNITEIGELLSDGYLVGVNLNSRALNNKSGYVGHFVIIKGFSSDSFVLHDPGSPAMENRTVSFTQLRKAWEYPDATARNIFAVRKASQ